MLSSVINHINFVWQLDGFEVCNSLRNHILTVLRNIKLRQKKLQPDDCTTAYVDLSVMMGDIRWKDCRINEQGTDWDQVAGDPEYAPIQRNFGDYIMLGADENRLIAVWTDGRNGNTQIFSRIVEILPAGRGIRR